MVNPTQQLDLRDLVLEHIGRYRISFLPVLERVFGEVGSVRSVIHALKNDGLLRSYGTDDGYRSLLGGYTAYQLTVPGAAQVGVSPKRAKRLNENALESSFRLLWLCCMVERRYARLSEEHLVKLFDSPLNSKDCPYCIELNGKRTVYRIRLLGEHSDDGYALRQARKDLVAATETPALGEFVKHGRYGNLLVVSKPERRKRLEERVKARKLKSLGHVRIEIAPDLAQLKEAFRAG